MKNTGNEKDLKSFKEILAEYAMKEVMWSGGYNS